MNTVTHIKSEQSDHSGSSERLIFLLAVLALILKIYCAASTFGETDVVLHYQFGRQISKTGLDSMYRQTALFNHTPVTGTFVCLAYELSARLDDAIPFHFFPLILRLPVILADFLTVLVFLRLCRKMTRPPPVWALVLFTLSPVAFMVNGYHGNVDAVMILFLVIAAFFCVIENPLLCGLSLGLACNIKIIPLLFTPVFFFFWMHRGRHRVIRFTGSCIVTCLAGWSAVLLGSPLQFFRQVLGYSSYWGSWGISYWLNITPWNCFHSPPIGNGKARVSLNDLLHSSDMFSFTITQQVLILLLKAVIILSIFRIAWSRRGKTGQEIFTSLAVAWMVFFVFSPGVCPQYMIWFAPFLLLYSAPWYLATTTACSIYLFNFYNITAGGLPWFYSSATGKLSAAAAPWSNCPWAVLIACLGYMWKKSRDPAQCENQSRPT